MENASKALIMAGGMLLAILVVSLLIFAWNKASQYRASDSDLAEIEDVAEFNSQFTNYDRPDVQGYEILSLLNRIVDYNERKSETESVHGNEEKYPYISITIDMNTKDLRKRKLTYMNELKLFTDDKYTDDELTAVKQSGGKKTRTSFKKDIEGKIDELKKNLGTKDEARLMLLARNIGSVFLTEDDVENRMKQIKDKNVETDADKRKMVYQEMVDKFNNCLGLKDADKLKGDEYEKLLLKNGKPIRNGATNYYDAVCAYYEYMQFKKAIFECESLDFDVGNSGRVTSISFRFTGDIH